MRDKYLKSLPSSIVEKNEHNMEHSKPPNSKERIIIGGESEPRFIQNNHVSHDLLSKFEGKTREVSGYIAKIVI